MIAKLLYDFRGIARLCGWRVAIRWALAVLISAPTILATRNLLAADARMGEGPFVVKHKIGTARLVGIGAFSGLREIWVRNVYSRDGFLVIPDNSLVVDLGANMGNFSAMALAANPTVRVLAVEPSRELGERFLRTMRANGFEDRVQLCRAFIGKFTPKSTDSILTDPNYQDAPTITEQDLLQRYSVDRISFLKCDIEGSEFFMLDPSSKLLDKAARLAIEVHDFGGDIRAFVTDLERRGFELSIDRNPNDIIIRGALMQERA